MIRSVRSSRVRAGDAIFFAGHQPDTVSLLSDDDLFVIPSVWQDALPLAVMERTTEKARRMREAGRERVARNFSPEREGEIGFDHRDRSGDP